jgi:hypothetical protein
MLAKIYSAAVYGVDAYEVEIEVNGARGDPKIIIVGLPDAAVKESRDRVTTAISNSGYYWPRGRTTINLAPADIKKEGPSFDLPIALGMIAVAQELEQAPFETFSFVGELALDGAVRPVKGVLPVALEARRQKKEAIFVPAANANEAAMVEGITVYGVRNLRETYQFVIRESLISPTYGDLTSFFATHKNYEVDFSDVKGQGHVKRAIEVAVAGGHNLFMLCNNYPVASSVRLNACGVKHLPHSSRISLDGFDSKRSHRWNAGRREAWQRDIRRGREARWQPRGSIKDSAGAESESQINERLSIGSFVRAARQETREFEHRRHRTLIQRPELHAALRFCAHFQGAHKFAYSSVPGVLAIAERSSHFNRLSCDRRFLRETHRANARQ